MRFWKPPWSLMIALIFATFAASQIYFMYRLYPLTDQMCLTHPNPDLNEPITLYHIHKKINIGTPRKICNCK